MLGLRRIVGVGILALLAMSVLASTAAARHYEGTVDGAPLSIDTKDKAGKVKSIEAFGWDGLQCGGDGFTGGNSKPIKVKHDGFKNKQAVAGVDVDLTMKVEGSFKHKGKKVTGTLKIKGACSTGSVDFKAVKSDAASSQ